MTEWQISEDGRLDCGGDTIYAPDKKDGRVEVEIDQEGGYARLYLPFSVLQAYVRFHEDAKARAWEAEKNESATVEPSSPPVKPEIIDLMEALRASLAASKRPAAEDDDEAGHKAGGSR